MVLALMLMMLAVVFMTKPVLTLMTFTGSDAGVEDAV